MTAIAERIEARGRAAEIDDDEKEDGERIGAEMGADPRQTKRQDDLRARATTGQKVCQRSTKRCERHNEAGAINDRRSGPPSRRQQADDGHDEQRGDAPQSDDDGHRRYHFCLDAGRFATEPTPVPPAITADAFSRTPRPPSVLTAPSPISSTPASSSAFTSFIKESTLPRTTPSLASMRWIVGSERFESSARLFWSRPRIARAALS